MSSHLRRIKTLQALIAGSVAVPAKPQYSMIQDEYAQVVGAKNVSGRNRRRLLQIVHSTRALDTCLQVFTAFYGCSPQQPSLGGYLRQLGGHGSTTLKGALSTAHRSRFQKTIVDVRNRFMHEAGAYPQSDQEVGALLSEMQSCLVEVLSLE